MPADLKPHPPPKGWVHLNGGTTMSPTTQGNRTQPPPKNYPYPNPTKIAQTQTQRTTRTKIQDKNETTAQYTNEGDPAQVVKQTEHDNKAISMQYTNEGDPAQEKQKTITGHTTTKNPAQYTSKGDPAQEGTYRSDQIRSMQETRNTQIRAMQNLCAVHQRRRPSTRGQRQKRPD